MSWALRLLRGALPGMPSARSRLGRRGERAAARHLQRHGLRILARNLRIGRGEIDILARDGEVLVFIEVKSRRDDSLASPAESITASKKRQILRLADLYLARYGGDPPACRFDVVEIVFPGRKPPRIRHLEAAFEA